MNTQPTVRRFELPEVPTDHHYQGLWDRCALVDSLHVKARVMRFASFCEGDDEPETNYEVQIDISGWEDPAGSSTLVASKPHLPSEMAAVCSVAAELLEEISGPNPQSPRS